MTIYTIGHSTLELDDFARVLGRYKIDLLADVRSVPRSRHVPQFNEDNLAKELPRCNIDYQHLAKLGGLRHALKDSPNLGWRNKSFRGYADYMQTEDFTNGIEELLILAENHRVAIMCAEAVPWRCHRSLIGDALLIRNIEVFDIFSANKTQPEKLTSFAQTNGLKITYPSETA
ncbi:MAG: DUF488 family protein [Candidatus Saccharimonadales bacterium]